MATNGVNGNHTNGVNGSHPNGSYQRSDEDIIGGSLGGLFAGVALKCHGHNTTILERNPDFLLENQGAGIVAGGDTIEFFKKYDRSGKECAVPSYKRVYLNQKGEVVHEQPQRQNMTSWDLAYYLLRANYDRVDSAYLEGGQLPEVRETDGQIDYRYGCTVTDIKDEGSHVLVSYNKKEEDGTETSHTLRTKLLVAADGPSSTIRRILEPETQRKYVDYCVIRGTVPETEGSQAALDVFRERFAFFHAPGIQNLTYTIAGRNGSTKPGERLLNFVWYANFPQGSQELEKIMTDKNGQRRRYTIPPGMISWDAWELLKSKADERLPPQMAEMAHKSSTPFVQAITDVVSTRNLFMGDKVVLVGDALAGFRPHTVASTSQAAFDVMSVADWVDGTIDRKQFVKQVMEYARLIQYRGAYIGDRSQFEERSLQEYIEDRNMMSIPRWELEFPEWTQKGLDAI